MNRSVKIVLGVIAASVVAAGFAIAQTPPGPDGGWRFGRTPPSPEMMGRMLDGKIAGAKAALRLTPEQEKLWPGVEQAVRAGAAKRSAARAEMRARVDEARKAGKAPDLLDMLDRGSARTAELSTDMKAFAEAIRPLYATLTEEQKQVLAASIRPMRMGGGWREHRGPRGG
jgi:LTXXQ motif family protein